ncbi:hypothetical protein DDB_G0278245 [Dictyostelium discoideum AX4]|uniref:Uncharacterized protein n=1 Tax=Dictyostelium discoideum TaxID=44689 RepID=Q54YG6_DICDI|nr:hypothetical protein DDB_G0278245 [Dictyostelium discoideum AX4]EAL68295.1 hypothetical protein DDB_G0278245 [Dictyostelium discoideum AX4]|eukprot:XP_642236.1 hypothetical protein DDB_G0278245 [Dictyostelium discoideum AX4]
MIFHQIWIWIRNQLYSDNKIQDTTLDYDMISKNETPSICNKTEYIKQIKNIKNQIIKEYCLSSTILPNRVIVGQFI